MTEANSAGECLVIERRFNAPCAQVFEAFTQPELLQRWFGPEGATVQRCDVELHEGGRYCIGLQLTPDDYREVSGIYEQIQPYSRLQYTWQWTTGEIQGVVMRVSLDFEPAGETQTRLILRQTGFDSTDQREGHNSGWVGAFENLKALFAAL